MSKKRKANKEKTSPPAQASVETGQKMKFKLSSLILTIITLIIALIGGIPGILQSIEFFNKTSARIIYDSDNSRFIPISSHNPQLSGKTALILLRMQVVGAGDRDTHIADIKTSAYYNGRWIPGTRLRPKLTEATDSSDISKESITVQHKKNGDTVVTHMTWREFEPGRYTLGYGEATDFSYACYYDIPGEDRHRIKKLRIRVYDYLGNCYEMVEKTGSMMRENLRDVVLLID